MFHNIPQEMRNRMQELERIDARDRTDGTPRPQRMRQIPPETGQFLALLAANTPSGDWVEVGTSAGYSSMWLALACRIAGRKLTTFEILDEKAKLAQETFALADVQDVVELVHGDALDGLANHSKIAFCFLDAEKEIYSDVYNTVVPKLVTGGMLVADNAINHQETLQPMLDHALADDRVDALIVPIGKGVLVCRKS